MDSSIELSKEYLGKQQEDTGDITDMERFEPFSRYQKRWIDIKEQGMAYYKDNHSLFESFARDSFVPLSAEKRLLRALAQYGGPEVKELKERMSLLSEKHGLV